MHQKGSLGFELSRHSRVLLNWQADRVLTSENLPSKSARLYIEYASTANVLRIRRADNSPNEYLAPCSGFTVRFVDIGYRAILRSERGHV
jgi:hypothetical protein